MNSLSKRFLIRYVVTDILHYDITYYIIYQFDESLPIVMIFHRNARAYYLSMLI